MVVWVGVGVGARASGGGGTAQSERLCVQGGCRSSQGSTGEQDVGFGGCGGRGAAEH